MLALVTRDSKSLPLPQESPAPLARWFSSRGSVIEREGVTEVFVGGTLIGSFEEGQQFERNAILVQLAEDPKCHLTRLAEAFDMTSERLRQLRRLYEEGGLEALRPGEAGGQRSLGARDVARLEKLFASGLKPREAQAKLGRASLSTVARAYRAWRAAREPVATKATTETAEARTLTLPGVDMLPTSARPAEATASVRPDVDEDTVRGGAAVQHVGSWLMLGMLDAFGLYDVVRDRSATGMPWEPVRVGLDAMAATFAIGEHSLEGARRLRTPTAKLLLRAATTPSPDSLRDLADDLSADLRAIAVHFAMVRRYLATDRALASGERGVFYVDNHMRPYTGKHVVRKGWRMQDKRVRPGVSDYYVHDEDGRPLFRIDVTSHGSLTEWLLPVVDRLREVVGPDDRVLLAFDRGGAFPQSMATLREKGCEFVTYERGPYPKLPASAFTSVADLDGDEAGVPTRFVESRTNLKKGRGRVRRIAVLADDGRQVNLLASSTLPAKRLLEIMRGRWRQENAFKHGNERWGINHLDARKVTPVPADEVMPNPARRRLDVARRAAHIREGDARCKVARHDDGQRRHLALLDVELAMVTQKEIDALRPTVPRHARVGDTELAGKLVRHDGRRKMLLDTLRIACANAESDLAQMLAEHLRKPREAKRVLATIFRSPGRVRVGATTISVDLAPAATRAEAAAMAAFLRDVSGLDLTLPGDPKHRKLRFRPQVA